MTNSQIDRQHHIEQVISLIFTENRKVHHSQTWLNNQYHKRVTPLVNAVSKAGNPLNQKRCGEYSHKYFSGMLKYLTTHELEFGYYYHGQFYSTQAGSSHSRTDFLHAMSMKQSVWADMESGLFYSDNLTRYF